MNSEELRAYTALSHPDQPEDYRVSEDGKTLYVLTSGFMAYLHGENLDKMTPEELYAWHLPKLRDWKQEMHL